MKKLPYFLLIIFIVFTNLTVGYASVSTNISTQAENAKILSKLGIIDNSKTTGKVLKSKIKKYEFITIVVKMLGFDETEDTDEIILPYKDVDKSQKEYNNIKIAYKHGIISENKNNLLSPNGYITFAEALQMVLDGLGYSDITKDLSKDEIVKLAADAEISVNINLSINKQLTYGEACVITFNSLTVDFK